MVKLGLPEHSSELDHQMATVMQPGHLRTDFMGVRVLVTDDNGTTVHHNSCKAGVPYKTVSEVNLLSTQMSTHVPR